MSEAVDGVKIGKFYMGNPTTADVLNDDDKKIGGCVHDDDDCSADPLNNLTMSLE